MKPATKTIIIIFACVLCGAGILYKAIGREPAIKACTLERCEYITKKIIEYDDRGRICTDPSVFTQEFLYLYENYRNKDLAEYHFNLGDTQYCLYWYRFMDEEDDYSLSYRIENISETETEVHLTKNYPTNVTGREAKEYYYKMFLHWEDGDWRLADFQRTGDGIMGHNFTEYQTERQMVIDYLAELPLTNKGPKNCDISRIFEYSIYLDDDEIDYATAYNACCSKDYWTEDLTSWLKEYHLDRPEIIISGIVLTHKETGHRRMLYFIFRNRNKFVNPVVSPGVP